MDGALLNRVRRVSTAAAVAIAATWGLLITTAVDAGTDVWAWIGAALALVALVLVVHVRRLVDRVETHEPGHDVSPRG